MREVSMKLGLMIAAAVVAVSSFPLTAQQASTTTQQAVSASAGNTQASASGNASGKADANGAVELRPVSGELQGKLDSKTAKVGDSVVVKTKAAVKTADGTEIPKGTKLVGRVTDVQAHGASNADSHVALEFDRAELKGGQSLAIHSVIESVDPPVSLAAQNADSMDATPAGTGFGGGAMAGGRAPGGSAIGGGGLVRGTVGGGANTTTGEPGVLGSTAGSTIGATERATAGVASDATSRVGSSVRQVPGASGSVVARATGVQGVSLANEATGSASGSVSGTLFAAKKNVHLDDGTQITLGVADVASR